MAAGTRRMPLGALQLAALLPCDLMIPPRTITPLPLILSGFLLIRVCFLFQHREPNRLPAPSALDLGEIDPRRLRPSIVVLAAPANPVDAGVHRFVHERGYPPSRKI